MTILDIDLSSVYSAAKGYIGLGMSVLPVEGKQPALATWKRLQTKKAGWQDVASWKMADLLQGVGIISGAVSGGLVVMDLDGLIAVADYESSFPELRNTYTVLSGSGKGKHFYYYVDVLPPTTRTEGYELRSNGLYVVAPPSPHTSGGLYAVCHAAPIMRVANLAAVRSWINAKKPMLQFDPEPVGVFRDKPTGAAKPELQLGRARATTREVYFAQRYAQAGLQRQVDMVFKASEGNRNTQLYNSAVALGQLSATTYLARWVAETALLYAAKSCGLSEREALATIQSGLNAGEQRPRQIPPPPPERHR